MLTKADFLAAVAADIDNYPAIAAQFRAGDPRILQQIGAQATMLSMLSAQIETAIVEPFNKVRDSTILADAAMRGIVPKGSKPRIRVIASNKNASQFAIETGRIILDAAGRSWRIETAATVAANGTATVEAVQQTVETISHIVDGSRPFYAIEIPEADDGSFLAEISVSDDVGEYEYRQRYVNSWPEERIFHVEADDRQRVYVRFGYGGVVGTQPPDGHEFTLTVTRTLGSVVPAAASQLAFEYLLAPEDAKVEFAMNVLLLAGQAPIDMDTLRDMARYPSVYDDNAVFMGEFDQLVRKKFPKLQFLSVWGEAAEEVVRGPSVENINSLFVACLSELGGESILTEADPGVPVPPTLIAESALTATQKAIRSAILAADDSYHVKFYTPVRSKIAMTINAEVATSYIASDVREKIIEAVLGEFGQAASASKRGRNRPLYQRVYELLKRRVAALSGGKSDLTVNIADVPTIANRPEMWRYVASDSLTVTVETVNAVAKSWGG